MTLAMNPWLQRFLVGLGGGIAASTVLVSTAENRHQKAKKRKKKKGAAATAIGTVARHDAAHPPTPGLTTDEWIAGWKATGRRVVDFVARRKPPVVDEHGARVPDEVQSADGAVTKPAAARAGAPRKSGAARRRRRQQRREASLWESAQESLRQVVKEEAKKVVDEKVEETGLKKAADTLGAAAGKVSEVARDTAGKIKESLPPDVDEKLAQAGRVVGRTVVDGARKLGEAWREAMAPTTTTHVDDGAREPPLAPLTDGASTTDATRAAGATGATAATAAVIGDVAASTPAPSSTSSTSSSAPEALSMPASSSTSPDAPSMSASTSSATPEALSTTSVAFEEGLSAAELAQKAQQTTTAAAEKLGEGVQKLGAFLSGPGNPSYRRVGGRVGAGKGGDVVEARDPSSTPPPQPSPSSAATPPSSSSSSPTPPLPPTPLEGDDGSST